MTPAPKFGAFIRTRRDELRRTLRSVAEEVGISAPFLSDMEHGRRMCAADVMERLATALGVEVSQLTALDERIPGSILGRLLSIERRLSALEAKHIRLGGS